MSKFMGRIFSEPRSVFPREWLQPELQSLDDYVDGVRNIAETQQRVAQAYFADGSVEVACPPLKQLLAIMAGLDTGGVTIESAEFRAQFTREALLASDWYSARLRAKAVVDRRNARRAVEHLEHFLTRPIYRKETGRLGIPERLAIARARVHEMENADYPSRLIGTIGADPALAL